MYNNLDAFKEFDKDEVLKDGLVSVMDGSDYNQGAVEDAQHTANKTREVLAKLLVLLRNKNVVTNEDLIILSQYIF